MVVLPSGAIHGTDPRIDFKLSSRLVVLTVCSCFEHPKSASFATPCSFTSTLAPRVAILIYHSVVPHNHTLNISVNYAFAMKILNALQNLSGVQPNQILIEDTELRQHAMNRR